jgi:hypothetical protein
MPVANHLVAAGIHMNACLAREKQHHQRREEHHVPGQPEKHKEPDAVKALARAPMLALPVVIAPAPAAAGWAPVYRGFPPYSRFFPFYFRWGARKGNGHSRPR